MKLPVALISLSEKNRTWVLERLEGEREEETRET
jgi:hypothetical protein